MGERRLVRQVLSSEFREQFKSISLQIELAQHKAGSCTSISRCFTIFILFRHSLMKLE